MCISSAGVSVSYLKEWPSEGGMGMGHDVESVKKVGEIMSVCIGLIAGIVGGVCSDKWTMLDFWNVLVCLTQ